MPSQSLNTRGYIDALSRELRSGIAKEHAYRPALKGYIESVTAGIHAVNDPARQACGAPDFVVSRVRSGQRVDIGYVETKDLSADLDAIQDSEQIRRYRTSLNNFVLTDYLTFRFFIAGQPVANVCIGEVRGRSVVAREDAFAELESLLSHFVDYSGQTITSAKVLAELMAHKAQLMRDVFARALAADENPSNLREQLAGFRKILIHDMSEEQFADVYAQTITYGLFTARLHDPTLDTFSRQEARDLIPRSNPFLRRLFDYVCGAELDQRVVWVVDALCELYRAADVRAIVQDFGTTTGRNDPIVHFYETFLTEYDPKLRRLRGVWYTPEAVVSFIVRSIEHVLQKHFGLAEGLASTEKVPVEVDDQLIDNRTRSGKAKKRISVHKVQLLDFATGTGTFTAEAVKQIHRRFEGQEGMWSQYVEEHLLPRLHGFEILMASYAMCHMKLDLLLSELGYSPLHPDRPPRLSVFLTNTLEEHHPDADTLFASWLAEEANAASRVKRDMPIMVVYGNPPYSISSQNRGMWIRDLIETYKEGLTEKKLNLDDDYIKFIRYAEHCIERSGRGVVAVITNNSFLDGITHRSMRKHLLDTFDHIYVYNLHGDSNKKERSPDGSPDMNVFDIQQGVGIYIMVKDGSRRGRGARLMHLDSFGSRNDKYERLWEETLETAPFTELRPEAPYHFFVPKTFRARDEYFAGFDLSEMMPEFNSGIKTDRDGLFIDMDREVLAARMAQLLAGNFDAQFADEFNVHDSGSYRITTAIQGVRFDERFIQPFLYRPYDWRFLYYDPEIVSRPAHKVMRHLSNRENFALIVPKSASEEAGAFVTNTLAGHKSFNAYNINYVFPLYLYPQGDGDMFERADRASNLNPDLLRSFSERCGLPFSGDEVTADAAFGPLDVFDYIYAVLHSTSYLDTFAEFLRINFPRIPYPRGGDQFRRIAALGGEMRAVHFLRHPNVQLAKTRFPVAGRAVVQRPRFSDGRVLINETQFFEGVPESTWAFPVGGFQPAQKWLKDREGRALSSDELRHWQKIAAAIGETERLVREINETIGL